MLGVIQMRPRSSRICILDSRRIHRWNIGDFLAARIHATDTVSASDKALYKYLIKRVSRLKKHHDCRKTPCLFRKDVFCVNINPPVSCPSAKEANIALYDPVFVPFRERHNFQGERIVKILPKRNSCLLYTVDAADDRPWVDLRGRRISKKEKQML